MTRSLNAWIHCGKSSAAGESDSSPNDWPDWRRCHDRVAPGLSPPELVVQIKALACELPADHQLPLARWSVPELARYAHGLLTMAAVTAANAPSTDSKAAIRTCG